MKRASSPPMPGRRAGFTFLEVVIAMVIVGILGAALARFVDFDAANKAAAQLTRETIVGKWQNDQVENIAETISSRSKTFPSLGDLTGYAEASTPDEAPETAPVQIQYSFSVRLTIQNDANVYATGHDHVFGHGSSSTITDANGDGAYSCDELQSGMGEFARQFVPSVGGGGPFGLNPFGDDPSSALLVNAVGSPTVDASSAPPQCDIVSYSIRRWRTSAAAGYAPATPRASYPSYTFAEISPFRTRTTTHYAIPAHVPFKPLSTSGYATVKRFGPAAYRYSCAALSARHGVPYLIRDNKTGTAGGNGSETSGWTNILTTGNQYTLISDAVPGLPQMEIAALVPTTPAEAVCERQGPAPAVPPATDGSPGNPAPKSDFSGVCAAKGWAIPTYGADGNPTNSASDPVARIGDITEDASCE